MQDFVTILEGKCDLEVKSNGEYNFDLDDFQKYAISKINDNENILVLVPTGSGKTLVAEEAILHTIKNKGKVAYTTPIKTLSNEKYKDLKTKFSELFSIGLLTGDNKINPDADCVIMTAEILNNSLYKLKTKQPELDTRVSADTVINNLKTVIMDEVHYINDPDRGRVWEETIMLLPEDVQLVLLSATIDKAYEFASWIASIKNKKINMIVSKKRVIPLKHYVYTDKYVLIQDENNNFIPENYRKSLDYYFKLEKSNKKYSPKHMINNMVNKLNIDNMLPAIFFAFSRKQCERYANDIQDTLVTHEERTKIENIITVNMLKYEKDYEKVWQYHNIKELLLKGIAYHHSGLLPILKEIIEIVFKANLLKVLFATETFAVGVNMPTKTVVFTELSKYTNKNQRDINTAEYKQMSGRAGRRGKDLIGNCIILPIKELPTEYDIKKIMLGSLPSINSKFSLDYNLILKSLQSETIKDINEFIEKSLYYKDYLSNRKTILLELEELKEIENAEYITNLEYQDLFSKLYQVENYINLGINLNNSKMKEYNKNKNILETNDLLKEYNKFVDIKNNQEKIKNLEKKLIDYDNVLINTQDNIKNYLQEIGYLDENYNITNKSIISGQINDCNQILLTEMILNNILDDLEPEELGAVLSIFISDKDFDYITQESILCCDKVYYRIKEINKLIEDFTNKENKYNLCNEEYWKINYEYIDITYKWICEYSFKESIGELDNIYEGNFVRNMLKLNNIIKELEYLCKLCNKIELLPVLDMTSKYLIRDIVNTNSIYLQ
jgi:superfamily II RNA helicase